MVMPINHITKPAEDFFVPYFIRWYPPNAPPPYGNKKSTPFPRWTLLLTYI